jgi:hypothetical protein
MTQETLFEYFQKLAREMPHASIPNLEGAEYSPGAVLERNEVGVRSMSHDEMTDTVEPVQSIGLTSTDTVLRQLLAPLITTSNDRRAGVTATDTIPLTAPVMSRDPQPASSSGSSGGSGDTILSVATKVFESGFGIVPLLSNLFGLFGAGKSDTPPPLPKYSAPNNLDFSGVESGSDIAGADYDQWGMPRPLSPETRTSSGINTHQGPGTSSRTDAQSVPQITVNVQAIDSRSFLDHSNEIAQAVRQAMLNLSSINDVVNEL